MKAKVILLALVLSATTAMACKAEVSKQECENKVEIWHTNPNLFKDKGLGMKEVDQCCQELDKNSTAKKEVKKEK